MLEKLDVVTDRYGLSIVELFGAFAHGYKGRKVFEWCDHNNETMIHEESGDLGPSRAAQT